MTELEKLKEQLLKCKRCSLHETKQNYVFGEGNPNADVLFIGEAPGANEDKTGKPFIGTAGKVFTELLASIDLKREDIYVANILKCRPPKNRNPTNNEIDLCTTFLSQQIDIIKPKVICTLGNFASSFILKRYGLNNEMNAISKLHGKVFKVKNLFETIKIIPLYHPMVAIYTPDMKKFLLKDFQVIKNEI